MGTLHWLFQTSIDVIVSDAVTLDRLSGVTVTITLADGTSSTEMTGADGVVTLEQLLLPDTPLSRLPPAVIDLTLDGFIPIINQVGGADELIQLRQKRG